MSDVLAAVPTPPVVYGVRCADPCHIGHYKTVYAQSRSREQMQSLTVGNSCNVVVVSHDGGQTWARAEP